MFVENGLINLLLKSASDDMSSEINNGLLIDSQENGDVFAEACQVLIALTLDDDIRVPFGKGFYAISIYLYSCFK